MIPPEFEGELEARKLESLAEFAAGAGHEINNPLATISGRVQLLLRTETDPEKRRALETIGGQAYRIRDMIGDVMLFARPPEPEPESLDVAEAVRSVVEKLSADIERSGCQLDLHSDDSVPIWADPQQLKIVIENLLRNSLEAAEGTTTIAIRCRATTEDDQPFAELTVTDNGTGLSELDRQHLFDPFYSGRQAGRGLGFGLSKCWRIVSNHGGRIDVKSEPQGETEFCVTWPANKSGPADDTA